MPITSESYQNIGMCHFAHDTLYSAAQTSPLPWFQQPFPALASPVTTVSVSIQSGDVTEATIAEMIQMK